MIDQNVLPHIGPVPLRSLTISEWKSRLGLDSADSQRANIRCRPGCVVEQACLADACFTAQDQDAAQALTYRPNEAVDGFPFSIPVHQKHDQTIAEFDRRRDDYAL